MKNVTKKNQKDPLSTGFVAIKLLANFSAKWGNGKRNSS